MKKKLDQPKLFEEPVDEIRDDFPRHDVISLDAPIARNKDIASSKAAAKEITASGAREGQLRDALNLIRKHPGHTSLELTDFSALDRYQLARRLPELERMGYVRKGQIRLCRKGKRDAAPCEQRNAALGRIQISHEGRADDGLGDSRSARLQGSEQRTSRQGQGPRPQAHGSAREPDSALGPTNGFWRDAVWLECTDGKMRPTGSRILPLAARTPNRVGLLRGAGNSLVAPAATAFIEAFIEEKL